MIWAERRVIGRMQQRPGPNRVGPFGLGQGLADGIKLALKEDLIPAMADKPLYILAPVVAAIPAFLAFAVIPVGPEVSIFGHHTPLQITDLPVAVLFILAMRLDRRLRHRARRLVEPARRTRCSAACARRRRSSPTRSRWASRSSPVFLYSGSLSTVGDRRSRSTSSGTRCRCSPSFLIYLISMVGETNRAPFDLPEAESELVGGFHTEYSSLKFAMFFLAEYINMTTVSALATTLFLGGWRARGRCRRSINDTLNHGWWPVLWFGDQAVRRCCSASSGCAARCPGLRYDQFMKLGWKVLIPVSLVWILVVAAFRELPTRAAPDRRPADLRR